MNRNYNGLLVLFFVALLTSALFGGGPEPRIPVGSADIADDSVTNAKLAEPVSVANGGTGKTTAAEGLAALGGASLNGSSTVAFNASTINGVAPLTAAEKTQALVGSSTVDFLAKTSNVGNVLTVSFFNAGITPDAYVPFEDVGTITYRVAGNIYIANDTAGHGAMFALADNVVTKMYGNAALNATKDSGGISVFVENGRIQIQNGFGVPCQILGSFTGQRP